jgi:hypothetical protein
MKDVAKQELQVGDFVLVLLKHYRELVIATIIAFTPKQIRVSYIYQNYPAEYLVYPNMLVKHPTLNKGEE